jgi:Domain of unknown function (DUF4331)
MRRTQRMALLGLVLAAAGGVGVAGALDASDHQDTPEVELNPRMDINDVYAFPGSADDRIVLVMTTSSPLTPSASATAAFDPNLLYQLKVDNTGDAVEDLVFQFTFSGSGTSQRVELRGPARPARTGIMNVLLDQPPSMTGATNTTHGSANAVQLFAGVRDDPFFIDLEQFFRIVPDRKPATGPLSQLPSTPTATSFRSASSAVDFLRGLNGLAIVVELPKAAVLGGGDRIGVWATVSR